MNPLYPIEWAVAWLMVKFHALLSVFMEPDSGLTWVLSIVGLTVVVRTLIIPLFVRQIRASRAMQMVSPELQAVQKKYKGKTDQESRQKMAEETMALYKEAGASPFSSCLPILLQMPIFFGLFRVLFNKLPDAAAGEPFGPLTTELARSASDSTLFGGVTIADSFLNAGDGGLTTRIVSGVIILAMCAVTFFTQKELTMKNMPKAALEGPMASTQKMMLYMLPFIYVITGPGMPIGVLIYWLTTNIWTFGQQYIVIRATPTPGSDAEKERHDRINAKRERKGLEPLEFTPPKKVAEPDPEPERNIRIQPSAKNKGGRKLTDEEKLERAREARAKAAEERRQAQAAAGETPTPPKGSNALHKNAKKKRKK
ncbi:membrane protein insertase YidC [Brachybacterium saurashtrense]|uniref:Membrane protein insertase YidC n=1 Tax=Brachybacterium saurashtrense TaxID=556288 RepID=A0A345YRP8_9MICO|nr:membrane protein insertase YidC [Brachybacterium saurashtrense]AXK46600.1 membrane protein insertase YidC [Brachybacterium saurashtrense]RRR24341.1 membrane protein insertase YidC [Brachybacterium saurashtrense]